MDLHHENQQEQKVEDITRVVPPVASSSSEVKTARRRRTERFAGLTSEADTRPPEDNQEEKPASAAPLSPDAQEAPTQKTRMTPVVKDAEERAPQDRSRVSAQVPSQGVPQPNSMGFQRPYRERREKPAQQAPTVRRPVQAEGYEPLQQLGTQYQSRSRRPEAEHPDRAEVSRRVRIPETERGGNPGIPGEEPEKRGGRGLIVVIIVLLVLAAMILGLLMIPEDDTGVLGRVKHAVTDPIKGLFGDGEDEQTAPANASDFKATISQSTMPYKITFQIVTSPNVTAVRVVDEKGEVFPTKTTLSTPNSENTVIWMFEMLLEGSYTGNVQAQIQNGDKWIDTGMWETLSLGGGTPPSVTDGSTMGITAEISVVTPTAAATATASPAVTATAAPTATATATASPTATATTAPTATATATASPTATATAAPTATVTPTASPNAVVTATPTMSVTATPTMMPTATPFAEPTAEPTSEPTVEPTQEPAPELTEEPAATPKLEAAADAGADPSLIAETVIYKDGKKVSEYVREKPMNMPAAEDYLLRPFGVSTFRGSAFRQNAAHGTVENPTSLSQEWMVEVGSAAGSSRNYYGIGWTGQPVIVKWAADIRKSMELEEGRKEQKNMKEAIVAGMDGKIYFLDLADGTATREAINLGYPMRSTPSLSPLNFPMMTVGQYARKMKSGTSSNIGLYYYNLVDQKKQRMIDGIDRKLKRTYSTDASGAFDTSALIDRSTNTLIAIGTNGLLYTEKLSMSMQPDKDAGGLRFVFEEPSEVVTMMSHTKNQKASYVAAESSLAMYGSYAYYADFGGILRCVDTTTMTTVWAVETGDAVRAAIALDLEEGEETSTLWLYTANLVNNRGSKGNVTIRRYNAMTGKEDWAYAIHCAEDKRRDVTFNTNVTPGAMASPVIGQKELGDLVYFTLSNVSATGAKNLSEEAAMRGVIIALNKATGEVVWHKAMDAYCYSSPVAVYDEAGKGWIIQACSNGTIFLLDGLTGTEISTLEVEGVIEGSPAVYDDMMVIGTTGKGTSYIYGIKIN